MAVSWTPRLSDDGRLFCSPACGAGCTAEEHELAKRGATALARRLGRVFGSGWRSVVWENMGWHYRVEKGQCSVSAHDHGGFVRYTAEMVGCSSVSDAMAHQPEDAVEALLRSIRIVADRLREAAAEVERHD